MRTPTLLSLVQAARRLLSRRKRTVDLPNEVVKSLFRVDADRKAADAAIAAERDAREVAARASAATYDANEKLNQALDEHIATINKTYRPVDPLDQPL